MSRVVVGIGNTMRRDDGVGPAVAARIARRRLPGVRVVACPAEPTALLEAWEDAALAIVVDAATGGRPGRVRRCALEDLAEARTVSSHDLTLTETYGLALVLDRAPDAVVVIAVDVADTGYGEGLSPSVEAALPEAERAVLRVLGQAEEAPDQEP